MRKLPGTEPAQLAGRRGPVADSHRHIQPTYHTRKEGVRNYQGQSLLSSPGVWPCGRQTPSYPAHLPHTERGVRKLPGAEPAQLARGVVLWQTDTVISSPPTTHGERGEETTRGRACSARLEAWPCGRQTPSYPAHLPHSNLQDANKKLFFLKFFCLLLSEGTFTSFSKIKRHKEVTKQWESRFFITICA